MYCVGFVGEGIFPSCVVSRLVATQGMPRLPIQLFKTESTVVLLLYLPDGVPQQSQDVIHILGVHHNLHCNNKRTKQSPCWGSDTYHTTRKWQWEGKWEIDHKCDTFHCVRELHPTLHWGGGRSGRNIHPLLRNFLNLQGMPWSSSSLLSSAVQRWNSSWPSPLITTQHSEVVASLRYINT